MIRIYGSELCGDCTACKTAFDRQNIAYEFIDINTSMRNLSAFMKLRDTEPVFDSVKGTGTIGLPCLLTEDETVTIDWKGWLTANGYTAEEQAENACSIDGKRC